MRKNITHAYNFRDEDRNRYCYQARQEGMTLSAWLRAVADERLERAAKSGPLIPLRNLKPSSLSATALKPVGQNLTGNCIFPFVTQS